MGVFSSPYLLVGCVAVAALKLLTVFISSRRSKSKNPFSDVKVRPVKPKVHDRKIRDAVLKQSFTKEKVPENVDAIVIGSGIGGLATAAIMSGAGKKVLVLEQHDQAGGCCHTFVDKGYEFDVGIHYIGTMEHPSASKTILDQITGGQLTWERMDSTYDEVVFAENGKPVRKYEVIAGKGAWPKYLKKQFPEEEENIDLFFGYLKEIAKTSQSSMAVKILPLWLVKVLIHTGLVGFISSFWKWNERTVKEVVDEVTENQELRDVLCYCFGDYGTMPSKAGFPMQATLLNHFREGAFYPVGGASEIAFHIIPQIEETGGKVLVKAQVSKILFNEEGRAYGVQVQKGQNQYDLFAPQIISAAGFFSTFSKLLPKEVAESSRLNQYLQIPKPLSSMSLFVGLDCPAEKLDIIHKKNYWIFKNNNLDKMVKDYLKLTPEEVQDADIPLLFLSFPSTKDPEWEKKYPGKTTLALVTLADYNWFKEWENEPCTRRSDDYEAFKKTIGQRMIDQTVELFPTIKDHIDYVSIGSPLSNNHYLGSQRGEFYGLDHTQQRFSARMSAELRPETDIPGLYLSGQDVCSCGFVGGLWGGVMAAAATLNRNIFNDIPALHKSVLALNEKNKEL